MACHIPSKLRPALAPVNPELLKHDFTGMRLNDAVAMIGRPRAETREWLYNRGFSAPSEVIRRIRTATQVEQSIADRVATLPPPDPCWRCAARGSCDHRTVAGDTRTASSTTNEGTTQL